MIISSGATWLEFVTGQFSDINVMPYLTQQEEQAVERAAQDLLAVCYGTLDEEVKIAMEEEAERYAMERK